MSNTKQQTAPQKISDKELRFASFEIRQADSEPESDEMILEGYAVVFDAETYIGDSDYGWYEKVSPGAFDGANLKDVPLKYNHNDSFLILARTRNNSLELIVDEKGLYIRAKLIDTATNRDIYKMVKSGLLDKMSFAFTVADEIIDESEDGVAKRTITKIDRLFDVSVVDVPAYDQTSIHARCKKFAEANGNKAEAEARDKLVEALKIKAAIKSKIF